MKIKDIIENYNLTRLGSFKEVIKSYNVDYEADIKIVVLTGGPCAGKTSAMCLAKRRFLVTPNTIAFFASEVAARLKNDNVTFQNAGNGPDFQRRILSEQITAEESAIITAIIYKSINANESVYAIFDRGIMDGQAYFDDPSSYDEILSMENLERETVFKRYDMVIHLVSAAVDATFAYTTSDGTPRDEDVETAKKLDGKTMLAWDGHPNRHVVSNKFKFDQKLNQVMSLIFGMANIHAPAGICKRYIIKRPSLFELQGNAKHIETSIDKTLFLKPVVTDPETYRCIRIRKSGENVTYHLSKQRWQYVQNPETHSLTEEAVYDVIDDITEKTLLDAIFDIDPTLHPLEKIVNTFYITDFIYCELSTFECNQKYAYLKVTFDSNGDTIYDDTSLVKKLFPSAREVTFERQYSEYNIAKTNGKVLNSAI